MTEGRIHRLEKEIDEMKKNNKVEISKLREDMHRALEEAARSAPAPGPIPATSPR